MRRHGFFDLPGEAPTAIMDGKEVISSMILSGYRNKYPALAPTVRGAETATAVGDVTLEGDVNLWHGAVLRGDHASIRVGRGSNIQDNAVIHVDDSHPTAIGCHVTVGHGAIVHGCTVEDEVIVGMGAILLNGCVIGKGSLVAAGALVTQNKLIPPGSLVVGSPAKVLRPLTPEELAGGMDSARDYMALAEEELPLAGGGIGG